MESPADNLLQRTEQDVETIKELFKDTFVDQQFKTIRLGRFDQAAPRPRPLKIICKSGQTCVEEQKQHPS